jgi:integrase/recombinase XerD
MWVEGTLEREYMRKSLHTQSWERARGILDEWEKTGKPEARQAAVSLSDAAIAYVADLKDRDLSLATTVRKREEWIQRFVAWSRSISVLNVNELDENCLSNYFASKRLAASSKALERVWFTSFFGFCKRKGWVQSDNPVKSLGKLKVRQKPTDYLEPDQFDQLLAACDQPELRALVLLLRWSGLRVTDALTLDRSRIDADGRLFLYQSKTGTPVRTPLPPTVIDALKALPTISATKFFLRDGEDPFHLGDQYRWQLKLAVQRSGITKRVHFHQLRDTFAVMLLLAGVPLDQVSLLLGHTSIETTQKHYAPFVKARQDQLDSSVRAVWSSQ